MRGAFRLAVFALVRRFPLVQAARVFPSVLIASSDPLAADRPRVLVLLELRLSLGADGHVEVDVQELVAEDGQAHGQPPHMTNAPASDQGARVQPELLFDTIADIQDACSFVAACLSRRVARSYTSPSR